MRVTLLSALLFTTFLLFNETSDAQAGDYNIEKVCMGQGKYAAVVEHNEQYYVMVSNQTIRKDFQITQVTGSLQLGGKTSVGLFHNNNHQEISVDILSRKQWKYAGLPGARSVCRTVVGPRFNR